jgi:DNA repair exonuclease SbcCD ATPase subunit
LESGLKIYRWYEAWNKKIVYSIKNKIVVTKGILKYSNTKKSLNEKLLEFKTKLEDIKNKNLEDKSLSEKSSEILAEVSELEKTIYKELPKVKVSSLQNSIAKSLVRISNIEEKISSLQNSIDKYFSLKKEKQDLNSKFLEIKEKVQNLEESSNELGFKKRIDELKAKFIEIEKKSKDNIKDFKNSISEMNSEVLNFEKEKKEIEELIVNTDKVTKSLEDTYEKPRSTEYQKLINNDLVNLLNKLSLSKNEVLGKKLDKMEKYLAKSDKVNSGKNYVSIRVKSGSKEYEVLEKQSENRSGGKTKKNADQNYGAAKRVRKKKS